MENQKPQDQEQKVGKSTMNLLANFSKKAKSLAQSPNVKKYFLATEKAAQKAHKLAYSALAQSARRLDRLAESATERCDQALAKTPLKDHKALMASLCAYMVLGAVTLTVVGEMSPLSTLILFAPALMRVMLIALSKLDK